MNEMWRLQKLLIVTLPLHLTPRSNFYQIMTFPWVEILRTWYSSLNSVFTNSTHKWLKQNLLTNKKKKNQNLITKKYDFSNGFIANFTILPLCYRICTKQFLWPSLSPGCLYFRIYGREWVIYKLIICCQP